MTSSTSHFPDPPYVGWTCRFAFTRERRAGTGLTPQNVADTNTRPEEASYPGLLELYFIPRGEATPSTQSLSELTRVPPNGNEATPAALEGTGSVTSCRRA